MVITRQTRGSRFESHQRPKIFRGFQTSTDGLGLRKILIRPKNDDWDLEKFGWDQKSWSAGNKAENIFDFDVIWDHLQYGALHQKTA